MIQALKEQTLQIRVENFSLESYLVEHPRYKELTLKYGGLKPLGQSEKVKLLYRVISLIFLNFGPETTK
jgi:hypothetical protein